MRGLVFLAYILLAFGMTYPWVLRFSSHTPDAGGESSIYLWNLWHFRRGLFAGSPFTTDLLVPPFRINLVFHVYTLSRDILALPLLEIFDLILAHNILTLLSFGLAGFGAFLLAFELTKNTLASFVAGLVYTFAPYRFAHLVGHYNLATIEWLPFYCFYTTRYLRRGHKRNLILACLFGLITTLTSYYYSFFLVIWSGIISLWQTISSRQIRSTFLKFSTLGMTSLIFHVPFLGLIIWAYMEGNWVGRPPGLSMLRRFSADLSAFITPSITHPVVGQWARQFSAGVKGNFSESTVYLGIVALSLAFYATIRYRRWSPPARFWVLSFWIFLLLSLGPDLHWREQALLPLPSRLLSEVPIFREIRVPSRFVVMVVLSLSPLVALSLKEISELIKAKRELMFMTATCVLILFEYLSVPWVTADRTIPDIYTVIAEDRRPGAVLDLPFGINTGFRGLGGWNPVAMYYQTATGRPIIGSHVSRLPVSVFEFYSGLPIIQRLVTIEDGVEFLDEDVTVDRQTVNAFMRDLDVRFIVVHAAQRDELIHKYILQVFHGCLEVLSDDGTDIGYYLKYPCETSELAESLR